MPRITDKCKDTIRLRSDIVAMASDYTALKKMGAKWRGLSPFQNEKSPSFYVDADKQLFYCFSSGQGGDIFKLVMLKEGLTFQESLERVAARFGVPVEYEAGRGGDAADDRSKRGKLLDLHEAVTGRYHDLFNGSAPHAETVRDYWITRRRFTRDIADDYRIGYAPPDGGDLAAFLLKKGFDKSILAASGLFVGMDYTPDPLRWRTRFRGRLMVPIRDIQGRVVAFTARQLDGITPADDPSHEAKYVNSPETDIFQKSRILFNLDRAKAHAKERGAIVLVEGQLDAIRCHANGVTHAVASQGTAIGEEHIALIHRYTTRIDALLDADNAGRKAVMRLLPVALKGGMDIRCLSVPGGKDPDEFLSARGPDGWSEIEKTATDAVAFAVRLLIPPGAPMAPAAKLEAAREVFAILSRGESAMLRDAALATLARTAGLDRTAVHQDFQTFLVEERRRETARMAPPEVRGAPASAPSSADAAAGAYDPESATPEGSFESAATGPAPRGASASDRSAAESALLALLLHHDELAAPLSRIVRPEWLPERHPDARLLNRILAEVENGAWTGITSAPDIVESEAELNHLYAILAKDPPYPEVKKGVNECLRVLHRRFVEKRLADIDSRAAALGDTFDERMMRLQAERIELRKQLKSPPALT